jgi:hypothetical protein
METQLSALNIPTFELPWSGACSPDVVQIENQMIQWAEEYGLLVNTIYRKRVARTRYGWLAARCSPNAGRDLLQAIADYFIWFFLADDFFVDRVETVTPSTLRNLTAMIDVLDYNKASADPVYGELAWLDVCRRLRKFMSDGTFARFSEGMRLWATTAGLQILNHINPESVGITQYEAIRRHTSGMNPCLALSDVANAGAVTNDEYYRSDVQALCRHANNIVCSSNDIQSLEVEIRQPGQFKNMVVIYASQGYTLQEGIDYTAARVREEIVELVKLSNMILPQASKNLHGFVDGVKYWVRGYQDWVIEDTQRYALVFADGDADDRGVL